MDILVEYKDGNGNITNSVYALSWTAFIKHLAIAGQRYASRPEELLRSIGMFLHYAYYIRRRYFYQNKFSEPPDELFDPTEKGQFSNLAGKAIADFLSKKINGSLFTVNYEAEMRIKNIKIKNQRPDLIAYSQDYKFAIESKGFSQNNPGDMGKHKKQAGSGPIEVNFSVACVSYDLYREVKCNYYDPRNGDVPYDNETLKTLSKDYYSGLSRFLNFYHKETEYQNEKFYEIMLFSHKNISRFFRDEYFYAIYRYFCFDFDELWLILPAKINLFAENGITNEIKPFMFESKEENIYIDNDRVGLKLIPR